MLELLNTVLGQVRGAWRYRWRALAAMWGVAILGWLFVYMLPNTYQARARLYVDSESVLRPLLSGLAVGTDVLSQVNMMSRVLLTQPNLEKVARETDLYLRAKTPAEFEQLLANLPRDIRLEGGGRDNMFTITYADSERAMAERVVQTLVQTFVEDTLRMNQSDTANAQRFLEDQIKEYERRLREAEERLAEFKRKNFGLMPGEGGDYYTRLQNLTVELNAARQQYNALTAKRDELLRQLEGEVPSFGLSPQGDASKSTSVDGKLAEYRKQLEQLLLQFTEKHPEVVALRETIANLEQQRAQEVASQRERRGPRASSEGITALNINPVYQQMKIALSSTEVEMVQVRDKMANLQREVNRLQGLVNTLPEVEAQLQQLNRDYEVNKQQHTQLLKSLETARLSEQAEQSKEELKFRVIEPAAAPMKPIGPNRPLLLTAVLFFALAAGGALAFVLHQLNPVFMSRAALREFTGLPVLGSVSLISEAAGAASAWIRDRRLLFGAGFGGLVACYVAALLLVNHLAPLAAGAS